MIVPFLGIILSLALLITLAYRGHSVIIAAPVAATVAVLFSASPTLTASTHMLASYTQIFMPALGRFLISFFPLFLAGAIFGKLMTLSGYADDLAHSITSLLGLKRTIMSTILVTALLSYGGISAWVIAFTMYPIAVALFREAGIPKRLMPAAMAVGIFTFPLGALPGSPQVHNAIPTQYFDTTTYAAPWLGLLATVVMFFAALMWLNWRKNRMIARGETFDSTRDPEGRRRAEIIAAPGDELDDLSQLHRTHSSSPLVLGIIGLVPIVVVAAVNVFSIFVMPRLADFSYLAEERFGATNFQHVIGVWSVVAALTAGCVAIFIMQPRNVREYFAGLSEGAKNSVLPALSTASEVGYGSIITSLAVFKLVETGLFNISSNPLVVAATAVGGISGITGSASGGLSITLAKFGPQLKQLALDQGISLDLMHRVSSMASVSFDSLPHNGAIITLLMVCGLTHRDSYGDIGIVTIIVPIIGLLLVLGLGTFM